MAKRKLRIGFDLDGVILYNPVRTLRPIAQLFRFLKPALFHEKAESFYFPHSKLEQYIWRHLHKTSFKIADGYEEIKKLVKKGRIDAYLITGRYSFLKPDFDYWVKKLNDKSVFKGCFYNKTNLQPNVFKRTMIKKLELDYFVEDNWGVIQRLNGSLKSVKVLWLSNILDRNIKYKYKFFSLKEIVDFFVNRVI
jgi:hypothetical protein